MDALRAKHASASTPADEASPSPRRAEPGGRRRIMVVDDDEGCRTYLADAFEALGCQSVRAADAGEALRLASEEPLDLICSDLRMPGMDGLEFLEVLRAHAPGLPCVVVSACGDTAALAAATRLGVTAYLKKPVALKDLEAVLRGLPTAARPRNGPKPASSSVPKEDAAPRGETRPLTPLNVRLLHKTTQLSLLTRFATVLREPTGAHTVGLSDSALDGASAVVVQRSVETTRRVMGAEEATLCLAEDETVRTVATCGTNGFALPVGEVAARLRREGMAESWHGRVGGLPVAAAPLVIQGEAIGFLCAGRNAAGQPFAWSDAELLAALAGHTAAALENASLGRQLEQAFQSSVASLVVTLEAKHKYTEGHSLRVAEYAQGISAVLALSPVEREHLRTAALLHDLGKVGVRDEVLDKPGKLTSEEWAAMRQHPLLGARILGSLGFLALEAQIVRHHHERVDGTGYPDGLIGEAIPLAARIIAVADAYDAMRSARSYRPRLSDDIARAELRRGAGSQFDAGAVAAFCVWLDTPQMSGAARVVWNS